MGRPTLSKNKFLDRLKSLSGETTHVREHDSSEEDDELLGFARLHSGTEDEVEYERVEKTDLLRSQPLDLGADLYEARKGSARDLWQNSEQDSEVESDMSGDHHDDDDEDANRQRKRKRRRMWDGMGANGLEFEKKRMEPDGGEMQKEWKEIRKLKPVDGRDAKKGRHIMRQRKIWQRLLRCRVHVEELWTLAQTLPAHSTPETNARLPNLQILVQQLHDLHRALIVSITSSSTSSTLPEIPEDADTATTLKVHREALDPWRRVSLNDWNERLQQTQALAKFKQVNRTLTEQIESACRDKERLRKRGQDDAFFQRLLDEYLDTNPDDPNDFAKKDLAARRTRTKAERSTKEKRIDYRVHEKLLFFVTPKPAANPIDDEQQSLIYRSLFA